MKRKIIALTAVLTLTFGLYSIDSNSQSICLMSPSCGQLPPPPPPPPPTCYETGWYLTYAYGIIPVPAYGEHEVPCE